MKDSKTSFSHSKIKVALTALVLLVCVVCVSFLLTERAHALNATAVTLTTMDGTQIRLYSDADASGAGYSWDAETVTLTLNGYSGRTITTNGDINLHLIGDNTLTLDPEAKNTSVFGLNLKNTEGTATITADEGGTLNIVGDIQTHFSAVCGGVIFISGTVNIDVITSSYGTLYAFERNVSFDEGTGEVEINVNIERTSDANGFIYGFYNGLNMTKRGNVTVNVDLRGAENDTVIAFSDLYVVQSSPRIVATADNQGGYFKFRKVVDSVQSLSLTEGGYVELNGVIGMYSMGGSTNANTVTTIPQNNDYVWIEYDNNPGNSSNYILSSLDGAVCEKTVFEYQETPAELKWVGGEHISIPEGKVDDNFSVNVLAAIRGLRSYDSYYIRCQVIDGQLPAGLGMAYSGGLINGGFTAPCDAGSATIRLTDTNGTPYDYSDDRTLEFTLNYGAVADKDRFLTVGDSDPVEMKADGSGAGWSYDSETKTLTLNGYNGAPISTEGELNIHLKGNNTVTLTNDRTIGIESTYTSGQINISADEGGVLNIKTPDNYTKSFVGIQAAIYIFGGTVNMDLASDFTGDWSNEGKAQLGYLCFLGDESKNWNVTLRNDNTSENSVILYGNYNNGVHIDECSNVEMNIDIRGGKNTNIHGIYSLNVYKSNPVITVYTDNQNGSNDCLAIDVITYLDLTEGGRVDLTGKVYTGSPSSQQSLNVVTTIPANNNYYWKDLDDHYYYEDYYMADLEGNLLDHVVFEYSAEPAELKWVGGSHFDIPAGAVGDYVGFNLWAGLRGASSYTQGSTYWKFEIIEGHLPEGLDFTIAYNGKMNGQIIAPCTAGVARIRATDTMGTYDTEDDRSVEFTIKYGAFTTNNPVSGLELDKDSITISGGGTSQIIATVTPSDALYPNVEAFISNGDARLTMNIGAPVNGVSVITVESHGIPGVYTVTVRTIELGLTKTFTVYVKESAPDVSVDYYKERLTGLTQGQTYRVSGEGIDTVQFVAESNYLNIPEEWIGNTINVVMVSGEGEDCDSEPKVLELPARSEAPVGIETTDASSFSITDGTISGLTNGMQYKSSDVDNWTYYWTPSINVGVGSYDVRYASTNTSFASEKITVTIGYDKLSFEDRDSFDVPAGYSESTSTIYIYPAVSGGKEPYVYSIEGPDWITIDEEGVLIAARPKIDLEATTATITVTDGDGDSKFIVINVGKVTVPHECVFDKQVATFEYMISEADCLNSAKYRYSCSCGRFGGEEFFEYGEPLGHNYVEKVQNETHLKEKAKNCQEFDSYWYECLRCDSISDELYYTSQSRGEHPYSDSFDYKTVDGHAHVCTIQGCGAISDIIPHTPGDEATEEHPQLCTDCGFELAPILPHTHVFVDGKCECGEEDPNYIPPHIHNFVEGKCECGEEDPDFFVPDPDIPGGSDDIETPETPETPTNPETPNDGLGAGAIVAIVIASVVVLGGGGFSINWFLIQKKSAEELIKLVLSITGKKAIDKASDKTEKSADKDSDKKEE